jgi:hypothetical protein
MGGVWKEIGDLKAKEDLLRREDAGFLQYYVLCFGAEMRV